MAHVWGDRLLDVRHLAGAGGFGPLRLTGERIELDGQALSVARGTQREVPIGATSLRLTWVEPQPAVRAIPGDRDWSFARLLTCLLLLSAALVAMFFIQVEYGFTDADAALSRLPLRVLKFEPPPPKKVVLEPTAIATAARLPAAASSTPRKADRPLEAKSAGLLGALDELQDAQALFAPGGMSPGLQSAYEKLQGSGPGSDAQGLAMGPRGLGPGAPPGLGIGGPGLTRRPGGGGPAGVLTKKLDTGPCCEATKVSDGLAKEVIAKVIRRHFAEIKFCYEQSLQQKPELAGKLVVLFIIDGSGSVSDANVAEATLDDPSVEACVLSRVRRWKFPEPGGGGVVSVTHPWFFKPAGSED